jgi:choline dehydrogenase-like flavoprotein
MHLTPPERRFVALLRIVAGLLLYGTAAVLIASLFVPSLRAVLRTPPWGVGAVAPTVLFATLCTYAAGDPRRRGILAGMYAAGQLVVPLAKGFFLWRGVAVASELLIGSMALEAIASVLVLAFWAAAARSRPAAAPAPILTTEAGMVPWLLAPVALAAAGVAVVAVLGPVTPALRVLAAEPSLSARVAGGAAALAVLAVYVAAGLRTRMPLVSLVNVTLAAFGVSAAAVALTGPAGVVPVLGRGIAVATLMWAAAGAALAAAGALWAAKERAYQLSLKPVFLGSTGYRTLAALAEVLTPSDPRVVPSGEVARNVDGYLVKIRAVRRFLYPWVLRGVQWHPVLYTKAPLSELDAGQRLAHLRTHFEVEPVRGVVPRIWDRVLQLLFLPIKGAARALTRVAQLGTEQLIRVAKQLVYVGYYSDARTHPTIGYQPFEQRPRAVRLKERGLVPSPAAHPLKVNVPVDLAGDRPTVSEADVCIVGTGAGGAVLAHQLAQQGKSVVMLEKGQYVEPRAFNSNEVEMIGKLYNDGVFQQTEDFRFTVLQGSCVGGTTVVNNAVSFRTPEPVLERWNREFAARIHAGRYEAGTDAVMELLRIRPQIPDAPWGPNQQVNPSFQKYLDGVAALGLSPEQLRVGPVAANVCNCIGCGYCNIGCRYGAKLSMLDTLLPASQRTRYGHDAVRIYAEAAVRRIHTANGGPTSRATQVEAILPDGRTLMVKAGKVVLSAGTIHSSYLLRKSGIGKKLPVGKGVSFNMGAPLTAEFDGELNAFDGLQISHFGVPDPSRGWVFETWYNPPVSQAINMPGWFSVHSDNMRAYNRLMAVGVLVGTDRNGSIGSAVTGGPAVHYAPTARDMAKLADGLAQLGEILLAAPGVRRVMLNTWKYHEFAKGGEGELRKVLEEVTRHPGQLTLGTGHPQGGNAISADPAKGVVGPDFRVHGYENLYVCDASVIPSSLTVNPQLTVMSLAHYAAPAVAGVAP